MKKITANSYLLFLPFLLAYIVLVLVGHRDVMEGDEGRYYMYAQNLLHGYYSPPGEVFLWNGPGYPLVILPFVALGLPVVYIVLLNAVFQYISLVFLHKTLLLFTGRKTALFFSIIWAGFYVAFKEMTYLLTEPLVSMLMVLLLFHLSKAFLSGARKHLLVSGFLLGYIVLTKVVFGYIILALLLLLLCVFLVKRTADTKKGLMVVLLALLVNLPYLLYTWNLTGKVFYWANSGGMSLYWASTPVNTEFGDWNDDKFTAYCGWGNDMPCDSALFARYHRADYDSIFQYTGVARDDAFKSKAIQNIRQHPVKYLKNCIANAGRLFFELPYSYHYQRFQNLWRIPPGAAVMFMLLFSTIVSCFNFKRLPYFVCFFMALIFLFLGASLAVSANQRFLTCIVPAVIIWTAYLFDRTVVFRKNMVP